MPPFRHDGLDDELVAERRIGHGPQPSLGKCVVFAVGAFVGRAARQITFGRHCG
jgi:hypothetical protein